MYAIQTILEHKLDNSESDLKLHYHKYDRNYANDGFLMSTIASLWLLELSIILQIIQNYLWFGGEYKYDWGNFENRGSYKRSTKGYMKNAAFFQTWVIIERSSEIIFF